MENQAPNLLIFIFAYLSIYLFSYHVIFRNWSPKKRPDASSCIISTFHGTPAVILALSSILRTPYNLSNRNTSFQNMVLENSIAYFTVDLIHFLTFSPNDVLFIAHHLATLFVFLTCRYYVHHGAYAILVLVVIAEVTSFVQNVLVFANLVKDEVVFAGLVCEFLSPLFYGFYSVSRGVLGPVFVVKMVVFYGNGGGDGLVEKWVWVSWMVVIVCANFVSVLWVFNLWLSYFRSKSGRSSTKEISNDEKSEPLL